MEKNIEDEILDDIRSNRHGWLYPKMEFAPRRVLNGYIRTVRITIRSNTLERTIEKRDYLQANFKRINKEFKDTLKDGKERR